MVLSNFYAIHRDPHHWKNPESFDPSRFLKKDGTLNAKPDSYLPFSAGRRVCLGEPVAKPELLLMCATLLQRLELCLPEGVRPCYEGIPLSFGVEAPKSYKIVVKDRQNANCWIFIIYNIIKCATSWLSHILFCHYLQIKHWFAQYSILSVPNRTLLAVISVHICIASQPTKSARLLFTYSTHNVQVHNKLDIKIPTVHV